MKKDKSIEVWAGIECTVNRVGDQYFNQLSLNGHADRISDLDMFAASGIKKIRYPVLWELTAPDQVKDADWSWADERLNRLRELDICPIVGFVHHGSGPSHTSLTDPEFPEKLAAYAAAFAARYPWIEYFTPVNEPLTTARFSGLYGHWYPHGTDNQTFLTTLLIQCKAIAASMKAIRAVTPHAKLVQTEDICKTSGTPLLASQIAYENERRWLSLDLLCGQIDAKHAMWDTFISSGIDMEQVVWFSDNACPPDIIGVNHYLTSNRFLDEELTHYPQHYHGGNQQHRYADVETVSVRHATPVLPYTLLKEVWERYQLPIAITEVHLCAPREEQLRWLKECWDAANQLQREGADIKAITAWSLIGSFYWNCLVTRDNGFYEPGVYDLRAPAPRPTALASMLTALATDQSFYHPVLNIPGFWKRQQRGKWGRTSDTGIYPGTITDETIAALCASQPPVLIIGATGALGRSFARHCENRKIPYRLLSRKELDITNAQAIDEIFSHYKPWAVINAAGYVKVEQAETSPTQCFEVNTYGPSLLAAACAKKNIQLLTFSSHLVFDGKSTVAYVESDKTGPLNVYGNSKVLAEKKILDICPHALIVRTGTLFSPWNKDDFPARALQTVRMQQSFSAPADVSFSPTYTPDLTDTCLDLLIDQEHGIWHLANKGSSSWYDLARSIATLADLDTSLITAVHTDKPVQLAKRPRNSVLSSEKGILLPSLTDALERYVKDTLSHLP